MSSLPFARLKAAGGFSRDARFSGLPEVAAAPPPPPKRDPLEEAYDRGYTQGVADARDQAANDTAQRAAELEAIRVSFARMDAQAVTELRERLRLTVLALCEETVAPLAIDPQGLIHRIERAVAMLHRSQDERRVLINPEDLALIESALPAGLTVAPHPSVERGGLRIETPDGGVEDGPSQWRRILAEAFHEC